MTSTERLRAMLDERGVEYEDRDMFGKHVFHWGEPLHGAMFTDGGEWTELVVENASPEQAIAATLGAGTCCLKEVDKECDSASEYMVDRYWCFDAVYKCSCGHLFGYVAQSRPHFCPNCGAKVVDE